MIIQIMKLMRGNQPTMFLFSSTAIIVDAAVLDFDLWSDTPEYDVVALLNQSRDAKRSGYGHSHGHGHGNRYGIVLKE